MTVAKIRKLSELFRAISAKDLPSAADVASQICKDEQKKGHASAARLLRSALNGSHANALRAPHTAAGEVQQPNGSVLSTALMRVSTDRPLESIVLAPTARDEIATIIREWKHRAVIAKKGLVHRFKLLFHGPPGCGKSVTAKALGAELGLPVYVVRFDVVIGSFLGQTALHLREIFHFADTTPCILLLDELDALGKQRGNPMDVGELDRIVIALMQELEHSSAKGLIVGATNLEIHLDRALWRRFDLSLLFAPPSKRVLTRYVGSLGRQLGVTLGKQVKARAARSKSFADAEAVVRTEARRQALSYLRD